MNPIEQGHNDRQVATWLLFCAAVVLGMILLGGVTRLTNSGLSIVEWKPLLGTDDLTRTPGDLVTGVRGLVAEGLSAWCYTGGYHLPPATVTGSVRGGKELGEAFAASGDIGLYLGKRNAEQSGDFIVG